MLFYGCWIFLWIKLHRFSHRKCYIIIPFVRRCLLKNLEWSGVKVSVGHKGKVVKWWLAEIQNSYYIKRPILFSGWNSMPDEIFFFRRYFRFAVVFGSISKIVIIKRYWKIKRFFDTVPCTITLASILIYSNHRFVCRIYSTCLLTFSICLFTL